MQTNRVIELIEGTPYLLPADELTPAIAEDIWQRYKSQVIIEPPTFKTRYQWQLTATSWAGYLPVSSSLSLYLLPKFPRANLYRMLEYVYGLSHLDTYTSVDILPDLVESLASRLCSGIAARLRRGIYRSYQPRHGQQTYVRGRLDTIRLAARSDAARLYCHNRHLTSDIPANQILLWTLYLLLRSHQCRTALQRELRSTFHNLRAVVNLRPCSSRDCQEQTYHRLNLDYRELHALCRFFLDNLAPLHATGKRIAPTFLVATDQLFERFVAAWMSHWLPSGYHLSVQERLSLSDDAPMHFQIDLVLNRPGACWVLDTKYKLQAPDSADVAQVIAYAQVKQAQQAILVYPKISSPSGTPLDFQVNGIRVRTISFPLEGDLDQNGHQFFASLGLSPNHKVN